MPIIRAFPPPTVVQLAMHRCLQRGRSGGMFAERGPMLDSRRLPTEMASLIPPSEALRTNPRSVHRIVRRGAATNRVLPVQVADFTVAVLGQFGFCVPLVAPTVVTDRPEIEERGSNEDDGANG